MVTRVVTSAGALVVAGLLLFNGCRKAAPSPTVTINGQTWKVELAVTPDQQHQGLSGRSALADDRGMLFVFEGPRKLAFYMRECLISLDIAFIGSDKRVMNVETMYVEPGVSEDDLKNYYSQGDAQYALEVPAGVLKGVKKGDLVTFSADIPEPTKAASQSRR